MLQISASEGLQTGGQKYVLRINNGSLEDNIYPTPVFSSHNGFESRLNPYEIVQILYF